MKVGIIGFGVVGQALAHVFKGKSVLYIYDKYKTEYQDINELVGNSEIIFVSVPTPMNANGELDLSYVEDALAMVQDKALELNKAKPIIVIRSTIIPGSTDYLASKYPQLSIVFNPEFLDQRTFLQDMENTNRVVIGSSDKDSLVKVESVYKSIFPSANYLLTDAKTAEMIKYAANSTLASQVMIANDIYQICLKLGINYKVVRDSIILDKRIGSNTNVPGPDGDLGFGGKCLPKDLNAIIKLSESKGYSPDMLKQVWESNIKMRKNKDWLDIKGATSNNGFKSI
jgi:UDPglucose 6-dehydrogenase